MLALSASGLGVVLRLATDDPPIAGKFDTNVEEIGPGEGDGDKVGTEDMVGNFPPPKDCRLWLDSGVKAGLGVELKAAVVGDDKTLAEDVVTFLFVPNGTKVDSFAVDILFDGRI